MLDQYFPNATLEQLQGLVAAYARAQPFKHVHIEDFFEERFLQRLCNEFPATPSPEKLVNPLGMPSRKHEVNGITELGDAFRQLDQLLQSSTFIEMLQTLTGIPELCFDPEYHGAGTHNNLHGQGMLNHIDFNYHRSTNLHRRLNLLIYLNPEWDSSWGGSLELHKDPWSPAEDEYISYAPLLNSAVLFETNEYSWHGFPVIQLPENKRHLSRKSISVYYYSADRPEHEIAPRHSSIFVPRPVPEYVQADKALSQPEVTHLEDLFRRNARHVKSLYGWQKQHLTTIAKQQKTIAEQRKSLDNLRAKLNDDVSSSDKDGDA